MTHQTVMKAFFDLFVQRSDTYAVQGDYGYTRIESPLTAQVISEHLEGIKTVGAYQFSDDDKIKWICFDFDGKDLEKQFDYAKRFFLKLRDEEKIDSLLLEFSGKKGYHVWVFCEEVDGASAKYWAEDVSKGYGAHEIFPKQLNIGDKYGNLVKLPLCIHAVSKKRSFLFDNATLKGLTQDEGIGLIVETAQKKKMMIPKVVVREIVRTVRTGGMRGEIPSFIMNTIKNGVKEGERHKWRFIVIKELFNLGYSADEISNYARTFNKNCNPPEDEIIVERHIATLLEKPERYLAKEIETDIITPDELEKMGKIDYQTVIETYKKWLHLRDDNIIPACLAVAITRKVKDTPLWLIIIGASGCGKSEIIKPFEDMHNPSTTDIMSKITRNTFLSGVKDEPDFATSLKDNPKLFLTFDFAQFVKLNSEEKAAIWAQLRDIYDGFIERKAAFGVNKKVTDIKVNWLICTTPIIDTELLVQQELGTRELLYRIKEKDEDEEDLMERVWDNSEKLRVMRKELAFIVRKFIEKKESEEFKYFDITADSKRKLKDYAVFISVLRADTESDSYTGELTNFVYKEMPTRVLLQLKLLFTALKNLDESITDAKALAVVHRIAVSSIHPVRLRIIEELLGMSEMSTTEIQKKLSIGWKTVTTQLYTAKQLGLVDFREEAYEEKPGWKTKLWCTRDNNSVINFINELREKKKEDLNDFQ